jgi:glycosyltransferase involved in cell wall biosynthesis
VVTRNGVDLGLVDEAIEGVERDLNRVVYTSRPERGLDILLEMWPEMKRRRPELKLAIAHYDNPGADRQMADYLDALREMADALPDVTMLGPLSKRELYREIAGSALVVYPCAFPEVSCISALEAAACGTPMVTSRYCALKETVVDGETGILIAGDPRAEEYAEAFVGAAVGLLSDEGRHRAISAAARGRVEEQYQWRGIAEEWEGVFGELAAGASITPPILRGRGQEQAPDERTSDVAGDTLLPYRAGAQDGSKGAQDDKEEIRGEVLRSAQDDMGRQSVSVCMIVKNAQGALYRCLDSVKPIADEIIICDTGSTDRTIEIAREYTDQVHQIPWDDDFAAARNQSIRHATKDWILWIDADEHLIGGEHLRKYLRDNMYTGYVIRQHHHAIDAQFSPDVPVRLFRNRRGIRFFGCVHEHPETELNEGVHPAVVLGDVHILHDGYVTEEIRRARFRRNLPLLIKDRERHPNRRLGLIFVERDLIHLARYDLERTGGMMTGKAQDCLRRAVHIHRTHFRSPDDALYGYSFPLYQSALELLGEGVEVRWALELGNQPSEQADPYRREFDAGLDLLRRGRLDLGTVKVTGEHVTVPTSDGDWAALAHRGLMRGSATATNDAGTFTYVEDRGDYEPGYRIGSIKDYQVDHREGRFRRLTGGRIGPGQSVLVSYEYSYRRPSRADEAEYEGRTASGGELVRGDVRE